MPLSKINSALIFSIILTSLLLVFSKKAILFLIYLLADKANNQYTTENILRFIVFSFPKKKFWDSCNSNHSNVHPWWISPCLLFCSVFVHIRKSYGYSGKVPRVKNIGWDWDGECKSNFLDVLLKTYILYIALRYCIKPNSPFWTEKRFIQIYHI